MTAVRVFFFPIPLLSHPSASIGRSGSRLTLSRLSVRLSIISSLPPALLFFFFPGRFFGVIPNKFVAVSGLKSPRGTLVLSFSYLVAPPQPPTHTLLSLGIMREGWF